MINPLPAIDCVCVCARVFDDVARDDRDAGRALNKCMPLQSKSLHNLKSDTHTHTHTTAEFRLTTLLLCTCPLYYNCATAQIHNKTQHGTAQHNARARDTNPANDNNTGSH